MIQWEVDGWTGGQMGLLKDRLMDLWNEGWVDRQS